MQNEWPIIGGVALIVLGLGGAIVYLHLRHSRDENNFYELLLSLVIYELGHAEDSSMSMALLKRVMPCDPDLVDDLLAGLEERRQVEFYQDDRELRVRISTRLYLLLETGNWRRAYSPAVQRRMAEAMDEVKLKYASQFGPLPA